jgi:hypothetical protein
MAAAVVEAGGEVSEDAPTLAYASSRHCFVLDLSSPCLPHPETEIRKTQKHQSRPGFLPTFRLSLTTGTPSGIIVVNSSSHIYARLEIQHPEP